MLKPEQVPDEVVAAARVAWLGSDVSAQEDWRSAIAAAINAWPGMQTDCERRVSEKWIGVREFPIIVLPQHQKAGDD